MAYLSHVVCRQSVKQKHKPIEFNGLSCYTGHIMLEWQVVLRALVTFGRCPHPTSVIIWISSLISKPCWSLSKPRGLHKILIKTFLKSTMLPAFKLSLDTETSKSLKPLHSDHSPLGSLPPAAAPSPPNSQWLSKSSSNVIWCNLKVFSFLKDIFMLSWKTKKLVRLKKDELLNVKF